MELSVTHVNVIITADGILRQQKLSLNALPHPSLIPFLDIKSQLRIHGTFLAFFMSMNEKKERNIQITSVPNIDR